MLGEKTFADRGPALLTPPAPWRASPADLAERALRSSPYLALRNVTCDGRDGALVLRGCLPTYYLKQVAQSIVARIENVRQVVNEIEVISAAMRGGRHE